MIVLNYKTETKETNCNVNLRSNIIDIVWFLKNMKKNQNIKKNKKSKIFS